MEVVLSLANVAPHKPVGDRQMSKPELCRRLDLFAEGNWEVLWRDVVRVAGAQMHTHTRDAERRGLAQAQLWRQEQTTH